MQRIWVITSTLALAMLLAGKHDSDFTAHRLRLFVPHTVQPAMHASGALGAAQRRRLDRSAGDLCKCTFADQPRYAITEYLAQSNHDAEHCTVPQLSPAG